METGSTNVRDLSKDHNELKIPDLAGLQKKSFEHFAQVAARHQEREMHGLEEIFSAYFAMTLPSGEEVAYLGYRIATSNASVDGCRDTGQTYAGELTVQLEVNGKGICVPCGQLPLMTDRGTFIINGIEKLAIGLLWGDEEQQYADLAKRRLYLIGQQLADAVVTQLQQDLSAVQTVADLQSPWLAGTLERFFSKGRSIRRAASRNPLSTICHLRSVAHQGIRKSDYLGRGVHPSHFGRLCLLETPEGDSIGVSLNTAILADVAPDGEVLTPYRGQTGVVEFVAPQAEANLSIGDRAIGSDYEKRHNRGVLARVGDRMDRVEQAKVKLTPVHSSQALGASAALIPFVAHDDANRALMGANQQKQALPLVCPEAPIVRTGLEEQVVSDAKAVVRAEEGGEVTDVTNDCIRIGGDIYPIRQVVDAELGHCTGHRPVVSIGDQVSAGQVLADGPATDNGLLALGRNVLVGYLCWEGYNFEDGIVVSDRVIRDQVFSSIQVREFVAENAIGTIEEGTRVKGGDGLITVGEGSSVTLPYGQSGKVVKATCNDGFARVVVASRRNLKVGDKLANRHGAKGIVTKIVPEADMPSLPDGRKLEMLLNPLGVPSRMNLGSILETHLGLAAHELGCAVVTPGFNGATLADVTDMLKEAGLPESGMFRLRDGRTGRVFDQETTVGYQYLMKLDHMVDDKSQVRATGTYDPDTKQPVGRRGQQGGKRIGVMETWALQAYGASANLQELLTVKSDSVAARSKVTEALINGTALPLPTVPASLQRLAAQLRGLSIELKAFDAEGDPVDVNNSEVEVDTIASASLEFVSEAAVREWSTGAFDPETEIDGLTHIELLAPIKHPWSGEMTVVIPVLSQSLHGNRRLARAYMDIMDDPSQEAVDRLFESLTRMLYGKRGWITQAISGKNVEWVGRSVICPGPELSYDTCSIPVDMAATLLEPVVCSALIRDGQAGTIEEAAAMLAERTSEAVATLKREAEKRYVLLHRAPVLHRMGIQAFRMTLADEDVVRVHPLTLVEFNADFDGDEMDVFLPLSDEAQAEARDLMRSSLCQLGPANGKHLAAPTQDMVLGCYYATARDAEGTATAFDSLAAVSAAFEADAAGIHDAIEVDGRTTTVGRALFNGLLPEELRWVDEATTKRFLQDLCARCHKQLGAAAAADLGDALMQFGFKHATLSGMSIGKDTISHYSKFEDELADAWKQVETMDKGDYGSDAYWAVVDHWMRFTERVAGEALDELAGDRDGLNSVFTMLASGARGNRAQIRQIVAMRGSMAMHDSKIVPSPIATNMVTGHSPFEYLISTFGARKGLVDTAIKTADAGYLFKRIMGAVQDVMLVEADCGSQEGLAKIANPDGRHEWLPLQERITGRVALDDLVLPGQSEPIVSAGEIITEDAARAMELAGLTEVIVRSPITCMSKNGICAKCYGLDLSTWRPPRIGQAVGVIAAQSIGEPCTQLTMRTFHPGYSLDCGGSNIIGGLPRLDQLFEAWSRCEGEVEELVEVAELCRKAGTAAVAEYTMLEMQKVYRAQGVQVDERHFEVVLRQMLATGDLRGVSEAAADSDDFVVAGAVYGGIPRLRELARSGKRVALNSVRNCMAFGKRIPSMK